MSAVSNSVMPRSIARWITLREVSRSVRWPKLLQPRPTAETRRPEPPRLRICMGGSCRDGAREGGAILARLPRSRKVWSYHALYAGLGSGDSRAETDATEVCPGAARSDAAVMRRTDFSASRAIAL